MPVAFVSEVLVRLAGDSAASVGAITCCREWSPLLVLVVVLPTSNAGPVGSERSSGVEEPDSDTIVTGVFGEFHHHLTAAERKYLVALS